MKTRILTDGRLTVTLITLLSVFLLAAAVQSDPSPSANLRQPSGGKPFSPTLMRLDLANPAQSWNPDLLSPDCSVKKPAVMAASHTRKRHPEIEQDDYIGRSSEISEGFLDREEIESAAKHLHPGFTCPMHPQVTSEVQGSCPICGMNLVAIDKKADEQIEDTHPPAHGNHSPPMDEDTPDRENTTAMRHDGTMKRAGAMQHNKTMQHGQMKMPGQVKPDRPANLFWSGDHESRPRAMDHGHQENSRSGDHRPDPKQATVSESSAVGMQNTGESAMEHARKHLDPTYLCPMHPQIVKGEPGNCPICGMNLVLRRNSAPVENGRPQVFLSGSVVQRMGVRTALVQRGMLGKKIRAQGIVTPDDERILYIHPRTEGWVEKLYLRTDGERVERKDILINFYSPWINQIQLEFIMALEEYDMVAYDPSRKTELAAKVDFLRNSLRLLNVMDMDIMRTENSRSVQNTVQLMAPQGGVVTKLKVREGSYVEPYQSMFTIVDLQQVWIMVDFYEHQAAWIREGHSAKITAPALPGRSWSGVVDFIYPMVDARARTIRARVTVPNPDEALLLNMYVQVDLSGSVGEQGVMMVPREAVIITGKREVVIKAMGNGHFKPVEIETGIWSDGNVEILSGLREGDEVVTSGQFLIDSESSLRASFLRMSE